MFIQLDISSLKCLDFSSFGLLPSLSFTILVHHLHSVWYFVISELFYILFSFFFIYALIFQSSWLSFTPVAFVLTPIYSLSTAHLSYPLILPLLYIHPLLCSPPLQFWYPPHTLYTSFSFFFPPPFSAHPSIPSFFFLPLILFPLRPSFSSLLSLIFLLYFIPLHPPPHFIPSLSPSSFPFLLFSSFHLISTHSHFHSLLPLLPLSFISSLLSFLLCSIPFPFTLSFTFPHLIFPSLPHTPLSPFPAPYLLLPLLVLHPSPSFFSSVSPFHPLSLFPFCPSP